MSPETTVISLGTMELQRAREREREMKEERKKKQKKKKISNTRTYELADTQRTLCRRILVAESNRFSFLFGCN